LISSSTFHSAINHRRVTAVKIIYRRLDALEEGLLPLRNGTTLSSRLAGRSDAALPPPESRSGLPSFARTNSTTIFDGPVRSGNVCAPIAKGSKRMGYSGPAILRPHEQNCPTDGAFGSKSVILTTSTFSGLPPKAEMAARCMEYHDLSSSQPRAGQVGDQRKGHLGESRACFAARLHKKGNLDPDVEGATK
jgi:hypothetical protein